MDEPRSEGVNVLACQACSDLCASRSRIVNGVGPESADILFVGEAPGAQEDEEGEPFVGRSGDVLDDALQDRGLDRTDIRITNCVRCRPPENRDPTTEERSNCRPHLVREIELVDPDLIVTLGKVPSEHLLGRSVAVTSEAGDLADARIDGLARRVLICVHPAATLYDPSQQETFEAALDEALELIDGSDGGGQARIGEF